MFRASTTLAAKVTSPIRYDLIVIGGGSAGLACSKAAQSFGANVALVDAVSPTPSGTTWGIGGTCANVGCIPKKLMHQAALVGKEIDTAETYGWDGVKKNRHNWKTLVQNVNDRIKGNNFVYRVQLNEKKIKYYKAFASFVDKDTIRTISADNKKSEVLLNAPAIVIATGLRPKYPDIPGAEHGVTSDDLFTLPTAPGKTLVVGASYVALECAGFLAGFGFEVDLAIRSRPLKGFDKDCVEHVMASLVEHGVTARHQQQIRSVELTSNGKKLVTFIRADGSEEKATFDTVLWAIGREPRLSDMNLEAIGVDVASSGRVVVDVADKTSVENVYALGDIAQDRPELTPTAIKAGQLLAARLYGGSKRQMSYEAVATTVFTPLELSTVGLTEEQAVEQFGADELEIFHAYYTPFEYIVPQRADKHHCYLKAVCRRNAPRTVLGLHFVGPNAAEVMQGYAVAFRKGITIEDLQDAVAIHPCSAEEFVKLSITKRSGLDPAVQGCCG